MYTKISSPVLFLLIAFIFLRCQSTPNPAAEKLAILETLNGETAAFFNRDYAAWKAKWIQKPFVTKSYINLADSTASETLGWAAIEEFGQTYMEEHPNPEPLPALLTDIQVRWYDGGAWVTFGQQDPARGRKRETRLMEKIAGHWKIAGMHTTIYGF